MSYGSYTNYIDYINRKGFFNYDHPKNADPIGNPIEFLTQIANEIAKTYHDDSSIAIFQKTIDHLSNLYTFANGFFSLVDRSDPKFTLFSKLLSEKIGDTLPKGELIGYKKAFVIDPHYRHAIVKLRIPDHAMRSRAFGKKCRCSEAIVEGIYSTMNPNIDLNKAYSAYMRSFVYETGKTVKVTNFDICPWVECSTGIHFFMDEQDAINYVI